MTGVSSSLIVRVKRRRDQQPTDSLCILEDTELPTSKRSVPALEAGLAALSTDSNSNTSSADKQTSNGPRRMILHRINTVSTTTDGDGRDTAVQSSIKRQRSLSLDKEIEDELYNRNTNNNADSVGNVGKNSLWVTRSKKLLRGSDGSSFVVVDLSMENANTNKEISSNVSEPNAGDSQARIKSSPTDSGKVRLLNPPTRRLQSALDKAFAISAAVNTTSAIQQGSVLLGEVLEALALGADPNFRRSIGGETALMLTARYASARAAERLLARGADAFAVDAMGRTALDYACGSQGLPAPYTVATGAAKRDLIESYVLLLNRAATRQRPQNNILQQNESNELKMATTEDNKAEYVFDIFCFKGTSNILSEKTSVVTPVAESAGLTETNAHEQSLQGGALHAPIVQVEGLRLDASGNVELVFAYDSDWSDLGDDEDPDSNDERYAGNDYPDEEESQDEAWYAEEEEDLEQHAAEFRQHAAGHPTPTANNPTEHDDESYSEEGSEHDDSRMQMDSEKGQPMDAEQSLGKDSGKPGSISAIFGGTSSLYVRAGAEGTGGSSRRVGFADSNGSRSTVHDSVFQNHDSEDSSDDDGAGGHFSRQLNRGTGRVQRPVYLPEEGSHIGHGGRMSGEALHALWGTDVEDESEETIDWGEHTSARAHRDRLLAMKARSGMHIGALPREFSSNGLPKFGADLSDDEQDEEVLVQSMYSDRLGLMHAPLTAQAAQGKGLGVFALGRGIAERERRVTVATDSDMPVATTAPLTSRTAGSLVRPDAEFTKYAYEAEDD